MIADPNIQNTALYGERVTSRGTVQMDYLAAQALSRLHAGEALPIFKARSRIYPGERLSSNLIPNCTIYDDDTFAISENYNPGDVYFDTNLEDEVLKTRDRKDLPIVFLVASGMPHATIYILSGPRLYTVGFGFSRSGREIDDKLTTAARMTGREKFAHMVEKITGAIYSADLASPQVQHEAKLVWVDYLTKGIIDRIKADLNSTQSIEYTGEIVDARNLMVSNECTLIVSQEYCEAAGFIRNGTINCLLWAQSKLNINIDCGFWGDPRNCKPITVAEYDNILRNFNNSSNLEKIINNIQTRLKPSGNICTKISKQLGFCGGRGISRRRKNIKRKNKSKNNKNKKTKKNYKRKL
jgi:hypothetical protein